MPVTIQPATLRYKNGDGQFQTADCIKGDIGDPSIIIDDTAGSGDTGKVWSADKVSSELDGKLDSTLKGAANGIAELDQTGKVPSSQLPSYVDDVLEYASLESFPQEGESGKIYVALDTNKTYRWGGSAYAEISESLALGETSTTAYRGDRGAAAYAAAVTNVETTPTQNSTNLITSGAVYAGLDGKVDKAGAITDVQVNGTSAVTNGVANIPVATDAAYGAVKIGPGLYKNSNSALAVKKAEDSYIKGGFIETYPIVPANQDKATFYGLAKAAGDTTQASSANAVGAYTEDAKRKITDMIEPQFRKIAEITTENNQGAVYINTDLNGDPFELTDVIIDFNMTASSGNGRGFLIFNQPNSNPSNTDDLYTTIPNLACDNLYNNSGTRRNIEHVWISGGRFFGVSQDGAMGNYSQTGQQRMCVASSGIIAVDKIRSIRTYSNNGCTFGNNSVITVYGR